MSSDQAMLDCGYIHPDPDIEGPRWGTGLGEGFYPFVRVIGEVSIFDFHGFDAVKYSERFPASSWNSFVPVQRDWTQSIWIKLSPKRMPGEFMNGTQLKELQAEQSAGRNKLMPQIECAHIGSIPIQSFVAILKYEKEIGFRKFH